MSRTRENRVKRNYIQLVLFSSRFCHTSCAITQSERSRHVKRPSPYTITNARRVACNNAPKCTHPASKYFGICQHRAKTIKKNTNSTQNKSETHRAKQYEVTSFLSTDCGLSTETCSKNVYRLGPRNSFVESIISHEIHCQLCWIVASMVLLDSKNIADAIVCAARCHCTRTLLRRYQLDYNVPCSGKHRLGTNGQQSKLFGFCQLSFTSYRLEGNRLYNKMNSKLHNYNEDRTDVKAQFLIQLSSVHSDGRRIFHTPKIFDFHTKNMSLITFQCYLVID